MSAIQVTVEINANSQESIFAGNLLKAPPLNRRGRKKWHERYMVLRANRTLECFKSRKAALSQKSPRRVIDLRACINLEIGLEYKSLQHILSMGTFKRTFFFAAPSDPLMLQWSYLLEKVKNAQDGESIEVLDIGLRKSRDIPAVHRVKPSSPAHRFSIGSPQKNLYGTTGGSKGVITLAQFTRDSTETINLRASQGSGRGFSDSADTIKRASSCSEYSTTSLSPKHVTSSPNHVTRSPGHVTVIPNHVPPPTGLLSPAKRNKDGYFVSNKHSPSVENQSLLTTDISFKKCGGVKKNRGKKERQKVEFIEKPGILQRGRRAVRGGSPQRSGDSEELAHAYGGGAQYSTPSPSLTGTPSGQAAALHLHSNMKRSFRYRKITLRPEKPLFKEENHSDSEDETETEKTSSGEESSTKMTTVEINDEDVEKSGSAFSMGMTKEVTFDPSTTEIEQSLHIIPKARPNCYSKVTVMGVKHQTQVDANSKLGKMILNINPRSRSKSQPVFQVGHMTPTLEHMPSLSQEDYEDDQSNSLVDSFVPGGVTGGLSLPARPPSDGFLYASRNSLDDILVAPPAMFNPSNSDLLANDVTRKNVKETEQHVFSIVGHVTKGSSHVTARIIPSSQPPELCNGQVITDRNSTESNDTGYTSGASPALNDTHERPHVEMGEFQLAFKESDESSSSSTASEDVGTPQFLREASNQSLDSTRSYIPLIFHCGSVDVTLFSVQVCLVETSDELIKDLIALKALENYALVDCDEVHGDDNVAADSDDFTVETALEDLEFGFNVTQSTQKDLFMRKVRQSTFEVQNLFGGKKPFSCDVVIRHADQMIVLPIEIESSD